MVDQRISPMLWCGRPPRLLLPQGLWSQLDPVGRSAVVVHELAHLRRRDHWVCWAEMIVSLLYWWHPVVWWIRRRLREEADLACDIWVTALHPAGRRAYAEALLVTRRYHIASKHNAVPSVGLGASTARAKRFARRLTMVMTAQISPRFSLRGAALVSAVGLAAYLASPLWACPPEDKDPCKVKEVQKKSKGSTKHRLLVPPAPPAPAAPATAPRAPEDGPTTFEQFMRQRGDREGMSLEERIRELEREIEQLYQELQRLQGVPRAAFAVPPELAVLSGVFGAPEEEAPVKAGGNCLGSAAVTDGQTVVRVYKLPEGKLAALTELMVRDDVPIRVRPMDDAIEVHASPAQQCIFELFCKLVNGDDRVTGHALPSGKLDAITELMVRSDVPILVEPGEKQIRVHGTDVEQAVFDAFCTLIHPGGVAYAESAASAYGIAGSYAESYDDRARQYEAAALAQRAQLQSLRSTMRSLEHQIRALERQADRAHDRAEGYEDKAEDSEDEARDLLEEARDLQREGEHARAEALLSKAEAMRQKAHQFALQAESAEQQAEILQEQAEQIEDQLEELEDEIEEIEEDEEDDCDEDEDEEDED
jgi:hypothetical protein